MFRALNCVNAVKKDVNRPAAAPINTGKRNLLRAPLDISRRLRNVERDSHFAIVRSNYARV